MRLIRSAAGAAFALLLTSQAHALTVNFDVAQADYTPTPGSAQVLTNQFASLGLVFEDAANPGLGAVLADLTGGSGSDPVHLYGNNGSGGANVFPSITIRLVNPATGTGDGATDFFSILVTDSSDTTLSAYDVSGTLLGSIATVGTAEQTLTLSGIGAMSRLELRTLTDATGYDDLNFNPVTAVSADVPAPLAAPLLVGAMGVLSIAARRRKG